MTEPRPRGQHHSIGAPSAGPALEEHAGIVVVRDDLWPGGTKARVLPRFLEQLGAGETIVYASPAYGYAQVALAHVAALTGRRAVVFTAKRREAHPRTLEAHAAGAEVIMVPSGYLSNVQAKARGYCEQTGATLLPFGFSDRRFRAALAELARQALPAEVGELWCVGGSGTLARALRDARPEAELHVVQVGRQLRPIPGAQIHMAPEPFEKRARWLPPFPSCENYDAKAWRFLERDARPGAVFWNVA